MVAKEQIIIATVPVALTWGYCFKSPPPPQKNFFEREREKEKYIDGVVLMAT